MAALNFCYSTLCYIENLKAVYEGFMSVDYKSAKHICNVVRRQIQSCYPDLHLHFTIHGENKREEAFSKDKLEIMEHPAGQNLLSYPNEEETRKVMEKNRTRFVSIARYNSPGFLGFFQSSAYLAVSFINYERFFNTDTLKTHVLHIAWHAISLYNEYETYRREKTKEKPSTFLDEHNILIPNLTPQQHHHRNLLGDIFSACIQTMQGQEEAFEDLAKIRAMDTLGTQTGFRAEEFPFPMCVDTLEYVFRDNINQYKKNKKNLVQTAVKITQDIGGTYDPTSIEQWHSFSFPAQQMAWTGHDKETILGAAIYTGENTYAQSIADIISDTVEIKPRIVTNLQAYNPFTDAEVNERLHNKMCKELLSNLLRRLTCREDFTLIVEIINKQNDQLLEGKVMGWCVPALVPVADLVKNCGSMNLFDNLLNDAAEIFEKEVNNVPWETLSYLSRQIFYKHRDHGRVTWEQIQDITSQDDEFSSIFCGMMLAKQLKESDALQNALTDAQNPNNSEPDQKGMNISDFISPNAIKTK